jgi:hypothetical protein
VKLLHITNSMAFGSELAKSRKVSMSLLRDRSIGRIWLIRLGIDVGTSSLPSAATWSLAAARQR